MDLMRDITVLEGDVRRVLRKVPARSVHAVVTSPPYWQLRDYGWEGQLGLERTPREFIGNLVKVFRQVRRVLRDDGTCWVNMGDAHVTGKVHQRGFPLKGKMMMPHRLAIALQDDGWFVRQDIVWHKQQPQPETVEDRPTTAHEYLFLLSKSPQYYYDADAIAEPVSPNTQLRSAAANALRKPEVRDQGGINAKVRMTPPNGWATGTMKERTALELSRRALRPKQNAQFSAATSGPVAMRNKRSVWPVYTDRMDLKLCTGCNTVYTAQSFGALEIRGEVLPDGTHMTHIACATCQATDQWLSHFAAFGAEWIEPCILAGCPVGGVVLDPFAGTGTTAGVAIAHGRKALLVEGNPHYVPLIAPRVEQVVRRLREAPAPPPVAPEQMKLELM